MPTSFNIVVNFDNKLTMHESLRSIGEEKSMEVCGMIRYFNLYDKTVVTVGLERLSQEQS